MEVMKNSHLVILMNDCLFVESFHIEVLKIDCMSIFSSEYITQNYLLWSILCCLQPSVSYTIWLLCLLNVILCLLQSRLYYSSSAITFIGHVWIFEDIKKMFLVFFPLHIWSLLSHSIYFIFNAFGKIL